MWKDTLMPSWRSRCLIGVWMKILPPYLRREISEHYRDDFRKWLVKKKFTCTVQRKTTLTWLKKILFSVFWIKRKINVLLSNIIHLLKRKRLSNNTQQWTIDKMTVFCASVHRLIQTDLLFLWQSPAIGVCFLSDLLCGFFFIIVSILIHKCIINSPTQIRLKSRNEGKRL